VQEYTQKNLQSILNLNITLPSDYDDVHTEENPASFAVTINGIDETERYPIDEAIDVRVQSDELRDSDLELVQFFINNAFVDQDQSAPFTLSFIPEDLAYIEENNLMRVVVISNDGARSTQDISFTLDLQE